MSAPSTFGGYVDEAGWYRQVLVDTTETIADLVWPTSVTTYSHMRRDPQLAAVLKALTLPLRRATWQIDPRGARPEVAALVADGLGLRVIGSADTPTGARVRGVRWADHCRIALLDLVFGHMPFEERYDVADTTTLAALSERMPSTIQSMRVDRDGNLESIRQWGVPGQHDGLDLPANHLLWYSHEREGSAWQGHSVLRPAYAAWLLKREMLRAHATGNRRFNHGVPTVQWDTGSDPTPAQMSQAQQYASAARAGDQSGGALPPGARLVLTGLTGGAPDTLGFIRYLDQQMSRMALAGMLDLGETPNGSRALGAEFVDLFLLTLQAHGDYHAEEVTGQTVARLVAYNYGDTEPVPAVVLSDVGSKREVTVEALQSLVQSGALTADAELDAWIRREWRLPVREGPYMQPIPARTRKQLAADPSLPVVTPEPMVDESALAASSRPRGRRTRAAGAGQQELPAAPAEPDPAALPVGATVDVAALDADLAAATAGLVEQWQTAVVPAWRTAVLAQVSAAVVAGDAAALATVAVASTAAAAGVIAAALTAIAAKGALSAVTEAAAQGVRVAASAVTVGAAWLSGLAAVTAATAASGYASAAAREAARVWQPATDATPAQVADQVGAHLDGLSQAWTADQLGGVLSAAQQAGRLAVYEAAPAATYSASETRDVNTCQPCEDIDGHQFADLAEARAAYATGGYTQCAGGLRCRGIVAAVWKD